jgi:UDP-glucose 4-epimerase
VVPRFLKLAKANADITVYGDGLQTRTFCHVKDNVDTVFNILHDNYCGDEVINIGNDKETTILELAKTVIKLTGSKSKIVHLPPLKEGDMKRRLPDNAKMKSILKRDLITLEDGIQSLMNSDEFGRSIMSSELFNWRLSTAI